MSDLDDRYISIILPVLNVQETIRECLDSLIDLDCPEKNYEIIVVDNGSTDRTIDIIKEYPVVLLRSSKKGSYAARNVGIRKSRGKFLLFIDGDCISDRKWLQKIMSGFDDPLIGCAAGEVISYEGKTLLEQYAIKNMILSQTTTLNAVIPYAQTANAAYRKEVMERIGYFDENMMSGGDADLAWRMQLETGYKIRFVPEAIVKHKHRTTVKGLFDQFVKYGRGQVLLFKKYRNFIQLDFHSTFRDFNRILLAPLRFALRFAVSRSKKMDKLYVYEPLISAVCLFGQHTGKMLESLRQKVFYP